MVQGESLKKLSVMRLGYFWQFMGMGLIGPGLWAVSRPLAGAVVLGRPWFRRTRDGHRIALPMSPARLAVGLVLGSGLVSGYPPSFAPPWVFRLRVRWVPRATILEGMAASAAVPFTHDLGILSKWRSKINWEQRLDMGGSFFGLQGVSRCICADFLALGLQ